MVAPFPEQVTTPPPTPSVYLDKRVYPDQGLVTFNELEVAKIIILDAFKENMYRHKHYAEAFKNLAGVEANDAIQQYEDIKKFFLSLYFEGRAHTLFIPANLMTLSENIFTNDHIRDFVLNWTDIAMVSLNVQDYNLKYLVETISQGFCQNKPTDQNGGNASLSLVNDKVALTIRITPDYVRDTLLANAWLICITVLYLFMSEIDITNVI